MSCYELWDTDDENENSSDSSSELTLVRLERRRLRDKSNPLDMPCDTFIKYFRVPKDLFKYLLNIIEGKLRSPAGSASVLPIIRLSAALRFLAEGSYQKGAGNDLFAGISQPTMSKSLSTILDILESEVCPTAITFPTDEAEKNEIKMAFFEKTGFPGIVGCVDGTHVRIIAPPSNLQHIYYNRKGFHSLNVMLVCDHKLRIRYVDSNNPGSNHDSFIWSKSTLDRELSNRYQNGERNTWLLGDAGYPLKPYLITPFRCPGDTPNAERQVRFNEIHSKARMTVERTIGVLKNVFRCIIGARLLHYKPEKAAKIINVCCALHNLRLQFNVPIDEEFFEAPDNNRILDPIFEGAVDMSADMIRQEILSAIV